MHEKNPISESIYELFSAIMKCMNSLLHPILKFNQLLLFCNLGYVITVSYTHLTLPTNREV